MPSNIMNGNDGKDNQKFKLIIRIYGHFQKRYSSVARKLTNIIKPKPIKINRFGKTFFVSGNLEYLLFWIYKFWERETYRIFNKFLDSNYSYIDIGAWIGPTVLYGAYLAKKVYAIEPDPIAFKELEKNVSLNPILQEKIELHQKCINFKSGNVKFGNIGGGGDSTSSLLFPDSKTGWIVDGITFDEFIRENEINDCNFIKMDIEGGESIVLPSMKIFLEINKPILYLSIHPNIFKNPDEDTKKVIDVIKIYKNIYSGKGKKIELYDLLLEKKLKKHYSIVATDEEWN